MSPTLKWKQRMDDGDGAFNKKNISDTESALDAFIENLVAATEQQKANAVYAAVKKVVSNLNKLNEKHDSFIETTEREELVEYIHSAVRLTGFAIDKETDLTEEWREW